MNSCFTADGGCRSPKRRQVKHFTPDGKFVGLVGIAKVPAGCKKLGRSASRPTAPRVLHRHPESADHRARPKRSGAEQRRTKRSSHPIALSLRERAGVRVAATSAPPRIFGRWRCRKLGDTHERETRPPPSTRPDDVRPRRNSFIRIPPILPRRHTPIQISRSAGHGRHGPAGQAPLVSLRSKAMPSAITAEELGERLSAELAGR